MASSSVQPSASKLRRRRAAATKQKLWQSASRTSGDGFEGTLHYVLQLVSDIHYFIQHMHSATPFTGNSEDSCNVYPYMPSMAQQDYGVWEGESLTKAEPGHWKAKVSQRDPTATEHASSVAEVTELHCSSDGVGEFKAREMREFIDFTIEQLKEAPQWERMPADALNALTSSMKAQYPDHEEHLHTKAEVHELMSVIGRKCGELLQVTDSSRADSEVSKSNANFPSKTMPGEYVSMYEPSNGNNNANVRDTAVYEETGTTKIPEGEAIAPPPAGETNCGACWEVLPHSCFCEASSFCGVCAYAAKSKQQNDRRTKTAETEITKRRRFPNSVAAIAGATWLFLGTKEQAQVSQSSKLYADIREMDVSDDDNSYDEREASDDDSSYDSSYDDGDEDDIEPE